MQMVIMLHNYTRPPRTYTLSLHDALPIFGIELEVIEGEEEARLVRKSVMQAFGQNQTPRAILDLGGGSLEVNLRVGSAWRSEEHTSELQSRRDLVCRLLLEKKNTLRSNRL